jgi:hypothetical protein
MTIFDFELFKETGGKAYVSAVEAEGAENVPA